MIYLGEKEEKSKDTSSQVMEKLLKTRTIFISGEINQELAEKVSTQLLILQEMGDEPIKVFINSQGGHVEAGDTIHDMIKFVKPKVIVIGTGWVASAGITIYLAADKENRYSLPNTRYMIHQPMGQCRGQATDISIEALEISRVRERINKIISNATNQPVEKVKKDTDRNYGLNCDEAVEYGIVNKVITDKVPDNPSTPSVQLVTFIDTHTSITANIKNTIGFKLILSPKTLINISLPLNAK